MIFTDNNFFNDARIAQIYFASRIKFFIELNAIYPQLFPDYKSAE